MDTISLAAATILTGLSAGLLYGWRVSVIPGTRRTSSHAYVETTAVGNIPLNDQLEAFDASGATSDEINGARVGYEHPWNRWHDVRTVSSASTFVLCALAAFVDVS